MAPVGKPRRRPGSTSECRIVVLVTEAERAQIGRAAAKRGKSMGELVREALVKAGVLKGGE